MSIKLCKTEGCGKQAKSQRTMCPSCAHKHRYAANVEKLRAKAIEYYWKNAEKLRVKASIRQKNKYHTEDGKAKSKKYAAENREKIRERDRKYRERDAKSKNKRHISWLLRNRLLVALKKNYRGGSAVESLGCSVDEFKKYIECLFQPGMTWDNHGKNTWHLDHIKPLNSFDLTDPDQIKIACNYKNMQPLWASQNLEKGFSCPT